MVQNKCIILSANYKSNQITGPKSVTKISKALYLVPLEKF